MPVRIWKQDTHMGVAHGGSMGVENKSRPKSKQWKEKKNERARKWKT